MDELDFLAEMAAEIMEQGFDRKTAGYYAAMIGDTPLSDEQGNIIVQDERGRELVRLKTLRMFKER